MPTRSKCECSKTIWKGRQGWRLSNGILELVVLTGGGHLASLRRLDPETHNLLWEAPWKTIDPSRYKDSKHSTLYGAPPTGPFLSGFTGHAVVLGYFGSPSKAEEAAGRPIHGEAASRQWRTISHRASRNFATLTMEVLAPAMQLRLVRELTICAGESLVHISERVTNHRKADNFFQWVQHATFGEPLLSPDTARITIPAIRACTWPLGYEGKSLLMDDKAFCWPAAPMRSGGTADLSRAFSSEGTGLVATALIEPSRAHGFVAVTNSQLGIAAGYWFPRSVFPWVTSWEENRARDCTPWNQSTRARGLEFGTTPFPLGLAEAVRHGPLFDTPTVAAIGANQTMVVEYALFAAATPERWHVDDIRLSGKILELIGPEPRQKFALGDVSSRSK